MAKKRARSSIESAGKATEQPSAPSQLASSVAELFQATGEKDKALSDRFSSLFAEGGSSGSLLGAVEKPRAPAPKEPEAVVEAARRKRSREEPATTSDATGAPAPKAQKQKLSEAELKERDERTLFVGNVPVKWDEKRLRRALREAVGDKYSGQMKPIWFRAIPLEGKWNWSDKMRKAGSIQKAYSDEADSKNAYVVLTSSEDIPVVARAVNNTQADDTHRLRADGVGSASVMKKFDRKRSVFVGNLPFRVTEAEVRDALASAGTIDAVRLVRDKETKECQGFAFVRFTERRAVKEALNLWPEVQGRWIRVMKIQDEEKNGPGKEPREKEGSLSHPAARRMRNRQQQKQRQKAAKRKQFVLEAKNAGLRTGKKKRLKGAKGTKGKKGRK